MMTKTATVASNPSEAVRLLREDELDAVNGGSKAVGESAVAHSGANQTRTTQSAVVFSGGGGVVIEF